MAWKARLLMGLMLTVMLLAIAAPAIAGDNNRQERREFREDFHDDFFVFDHDFDGCCDDDFDDEDVEFVEYDFVSFFFVLEEIDVDCDDVDDDLDGLIDEGAIVCEVEYEFDDLD